MLTFGAIHYGRPSSKPSHVATMCIPLPRVSHDTCVSERVKFSSHRRANSSAHRRLFLFLFLYLHSHPSPFSSHPQLEPTQSQIFQHATASTKHNSDRRISSYCAIKQVPVVGSCVCLVTSNCPSSKHLTRRSTIRNGAD